MTLLLRLEGPLQSWGYRSRFSDRETGTEPTKSGVVGLLCCALGRDRAEDPKDLAELQMHVRVDREGRLLRDFHTAGGGVFNGRRDYFAPTSAGGKGKNPVITQKHYLQSASFLVALEGEAARLAELDWALRDPAWPLSLGRKSCPPTVPVLVGLRPMPAHDALDAEAFPLRLRDRSLERQPSRLVIELDSGNTNGEPRQDVPIRWPDRQNRSYGIRYVAVKHL